MFIFAPRDNMSTSRQDSTSRRNRYARSSTSVTQLLSDSCTSLLQKLTTRVRGTSNLNDRGTGTTAGDRRSPNINRLGSTTRSRLEEKYSTILDKYSSKKRADDSERNTHGYPQKQERNHSYYCRDNSPFVRDDKTLEPSVTRTIIKSPTNVILSEKAYPYVSPTIGKESKREKTPAYSRTDRQTLLNSETYRRYGRHKSGHTETRNRKVRPQRSGKSEQLEGHSTPLRLSRPVKIDPLTLTDSKETAVDPDRTPIANINTENLNGAIQSVDTQEKVPDVIMEDEDPTISDRAAKRKEIQSLIMKYAVMEDTYSQLAAGGQADICPSMTDIIANKYKKNNNQNNHKDSSKSTVVPCACVINEVDASHDTTVSCRIAAAAAAQYGFCICESGAVLSRACYCYVVLSSSSVCEVQSACATCEFLLTSHNIPLHFCRSLLFNFGGWAKRLKGIGKES